MKELSGHLASISATSAASVASFIGKKKAAARLGAVIKRQSMSTESGCGNGNEGGNDMAFFVLCANLLAASFILVYAAELFFLLVGSIVFAYKALSHKGH